MPLCIVLRVCFFCLFKKLCKILGRSSACAAASSLTITLVAMFAFKALEADRNQGSFLDALLEKKREGIYSKFHPSETFSFFKARERGFLLSLLNSPFP